MPTEQKNKAQKTCFVVMPIADMDDYETGHFSRVYNYIIKPACTKAGFIAVRADDVVSSNYIVIDILNKIVQSDMVIYDLSGRNPNVMYELGVRQAFNLPTVLIKDMKTNRIFDIQGLRCADYNHNLRIDTVEKSVDIISSALVETEKANGTDINSLIQLLGIAPAKIPQPVEISNESRLLLSAIKDLSGRIGLMENSGKRSKYRNQINNINFIQDNLDGTYTINGFKTSIGDDLFINGTAIGTLVDVHSDSIFLKRSNGQNLELSILDSQFSEIATIPF